MKEDHKTFRSVRYLFSARFVTTWAADHSDVLKY